MGQFSWICSDTGHALLEGRIDATRCKPDTWTKKAFLLIPRQFGGGYYATDDYDGYGTFYDKDGNPHDAYEELARWNGVTGRFSQASRENAIDLYYTPENPGISRYAPGNYNTERTMKFPLKITENPMKYEDAKPSVSDRNQGWGECPDEDQE